jgi:uncharacterized protein
VAAAATAQGLQLLAFALCAIVLAAFAEEVFFRGILLPFAARVVGIRAGLVVQAVMFAAVHLIGDPGIWPLAVPLAVVGWVCGWLYVRTGSLAVPIVAHATFNAINFAGAVSGMGE